MRGDKHIFEATMFAGLNGVFIGIKKGAFLISLNNRKPSWRNDPIGFLKICLVCTQDLNKFQS